MEVLEQTYFPSTLLIDYLDVGFLCIQVSEKGDNCAEWPSLKVSNSQFINGVARLGGVISSYMKGTSAILSFRLH